MKLAIFITGTLIILTNALYCQSDDMKERGTFIDLIENQEYGWARIGDQIWMTENLNYEAISEMKAMYRSESYYMKYGRLYDWHTAMQACPSGWHLPSDMEWQRMERFLGMASPEDVGDRGGDDYVGYKLQSDSSEIHTVDRSGFNAQFGGEFYYQSEIPPGDKGSWWTSTLNQSGDAWTRGVTRMKPGSDSSGSSVERSVRKVSSFRSVRCVKD